MAGVMERLGTLLQSTTADRRAERINTVTTNQHAHFRKWRDNIDMNASREIMGVAELMKDQQPDAARLNLVGNRFLSTSGITSRADRNTPFFAGPDSIAFFKRQNEYLSVADAAFSGTCGFQDRLDGRLDELVI